MELIIGCQGEVRRMVTNDMTAARCGSGLLPVFATPQLVAMMEEAACKAIESGLSDSETTVGTAINVEHTAATPVGMRVWAEAELIQIDRRALYFEIKAFDEKGSIGTAKHTRFVVDKKKFMDKCEAKKL